MEFNEIKKKVKNNKNIRVTYSDVLNFQEEDPNFVVKNAIDKNIIFGNYIVKFIWNDITIKYTNEGIFANDK